MQGRAPVLMVEPSYLYLLTSSMALPEVTLEPWDCFRWSVRKQPAQLHYESGPRTFVNLHV